MIRHSLFLLFLLSLMPTSYADQAVNDCHPAIDRSQANYLVGYGSLMNKQSRSKTNPNVTQLLPVKVKGFVRDWNAVSPNYKIIYVGARRCKANEEHCFLNGLAYLDPDVMATDAREGIYCRQEIPANNIQPYKKEDHIDPKAKYWIYTTKKENRHHPDSEHPLIQSYVDLFIGGCIEQAADITHKTTDKLLFPDDYGFVFDCVSGTKGWTTNFWLNDRVYPERPWAMSPYALKIDQVLLKSYQDNMITGNYSYIDIPLQ